MFKGRVDSEILPDEHVSSHYIVVYRDLIYDMASETKIKNHLILVTKYRRKVLVEVVGFEPTGSLRHRRLSKPMP